MTIQIETQDGVMRIALARVAKKNALTTEMYAALAEAFAAAQADPEVYAVVLHGEGGTFTAGNDLEDFLHRPPEAGDTPVFRFMSQVLVFDKPLIAAVTGLAVGIGTTVLTHCDLVYSADDARFSLPFVSLGLCPEFGASLTLPMLGGHRWAAEKLMFGEAFSAQEAMQVGLVNRLLPSSEVLPFAMQQAARLRSQPAQALQTAKRLMKKPHRTQLLQAVEDEAVQFMQLLKGAEAKAAFAAFAARKSKASSGGGA